MVFEASETAHLHFLGVFKKPLLKPSVLDNRANKLHTTDFFGHILTETQYGVYSIMQRNLSQFL